MDKSEDNPQNKENNNLQEAQGNLLKWEESLFKTSPKDLYTFKKTEKICSAIHFVTNFFNDKEPIRTSLREKSIDLLSLSLSFIRNADLPLLLSSMSVRLIEIKSLLQTAYFSGLLSEMNFQVIKDELDNLLSIVESKRQNLFTLPVSFLEEGVPELFKEPIRQDKRQERESLTETQMSYNKPNRESKSTVSHNSVSNSSFISERGQKIMSILKDGKALNIRDFAESIEGCSEKTLQRELLKLVSQGKIIKTGERRWSKYSVR